MTFTNFYFVVVGRRTASIICVRCRVCISTNFGLDGLSIKEKTR